jgi:hypothetical protein
MKPDTDNASESSQRPHLVSYAVVFLVLMVLYPLSFAPAAWLVGKDYLDAANPIIGIYIPLFTVYPLLPKPIAQAYDEYLSWWGIFLAR